MQLAMKKSSAGLAFILRKPQVAVVVVTAGTQLALNPNSMH